MSPFPPSAAPRQCTALIVPQRACGIKLPHCRRPLFPSSARPPSCRSIVQGTSQAVSSRLPRGAAEGSGCEHSDEGSACRLSLPSVASPKGTAPTVLQRACGIQLPHCRRPSRSASAATFESEFPLIVPEAASVLPRRFPFTPSASAESPRQSPPSAGWFPRAPSRSCGSAPGPRSATPTPAGRDFIETADDLKTMLEQFTKIAERLAR